jgi:hypothetical protein
MGKLFAGGQFCSQVALQLLREREIISLYV